MRYLFKFFGIVTVVLCLSALGFLKAYSKRRQIRRLEDLYAAFSRADDMLRFGISRREDIISECFSGFEGFGLKDGTAVFEKAPGGIDGAVNAFFTEFGGGDLETEHNRIDRVKKELFSLISDEKDEYARLYKVWQTAGVCAGLAVGIMFV